MKEQKAAAAELAAQENAYQQKVADLQKKSEEGGVVSRNKAKAELEQGPPLSLAHSLFFSSRFFLFLFLLQNYICQNNYSFPSAVKAEDPLPLRKAKLNQEAAVRKSEKSKKIAEEKADAAKVPLLSLIQNLKKSFISSFLSSNS